MKLAYLFCFTTITVVVVGLYLTTIRSVWGNVDVAKGSLLTAPTFIFESSHDRAPYALMLSLDENNSFSLTKELAEFASPDVGVFNNKFYILFPPGMSLYVYPFFTLGKMIGVSHLFSVLSVILLAICCFILITIISNRMFSLSIWESILAGFVFSFGTTSWGYATTLYQHIPTTFLLLLGFYGVWKSKKNSKTRITWGILVWLTYGFGVFIDLPNLLLLSPIIIYFLFSNICFSEHKSKYTITLNMSILITSVAFLALLLAHAYYNTVAFGDWKTYGQTLTRYEGEEKYENKLIQRAKDATVSGTLKKKTSSVLKEENIVNGIYRLTIADDKGLFVFSPILILGIIGFFLIRKEQSIEYIVTISIIVINFFIYASFSDVWGGWAYGPRYLIPSMALFSIGVALFVAKFRFQFIGRLIFLSTYSYSAAIALLGVLTTNAIPPSVEAIGLGVKSNYLYSFDFFNLGKTGSIVYATWFSNMTLFTYATCLFSILLGSVIAITIIPYIYRHINKGNSL